MIGKLNKRAEFQTGTRTSNGSGGFTKTWNKTFVVWCRLIPKLGNESVTGRQQTHEVRYEIKIRYRTDIKSSMRILINDEVYNVKSFVDLESNEKYLTISAIKGQVV